MGIARARYRRICFADEWRFCESDMVAAGTPTTPVPGTIPDLVFMDRYKPHIRYAGVLLVTRLQEKTPWIGGVVATSGTNTPATVDPTPLNSLNVLKWPAASGIYVIFQPFTLPTACTLFVVAKGTTTAGGNQAILGCSATVVISLYLTISGAAAISLVSTGLAVIGTSSSTWTAGTFFQANVTYTASSGAFCIPSR